jgi:uncharacterized membrane protein required for colicin V production
MSLIIDITIILTAVTTIYLGATRGFVKSVMGFTSLLIGIVAVYFFTAPAADWLNENLIRSWVESIVDDSITGIITAGESRLELSKIIEDRPDALDAVAIRFGYNLDEIEEYYVSALRGETDSIALTKLTSYIAGPTANAISNAAGAIGVFLATMIILKIITFILDLICRLPVLNTLNTFLGFLFGVASAVVKAWIISNMAYALIFALGAINNEIFNKSAINGSIIIRFFIDNNLLIMK